MWLSFGGGKGWVDFYLGCADTAYDSRIDREIVEGLLFVRSSWKEHSCGGRYVPRTDNTAAAIIVSSMGR
jgi:hypothetical protein